MFKINWDIFEKVVICRKNKIPLKSILLFHILLSKLKKGPLSFQKFHLFSNSIKNFRSKTDNNIIDSIYLWLNYVEFLYECASRLDNYMPKT